MSGDRLRSVVLFVVGLSLIMIGVKLVTFIEAVTTRDGVYYEVHPYDIPGMFIVVIGIVVLCAAFVRSSGAVFRIRWGR